MSATGQGGISVITGSNHAQLAPVSIGSLSTLEFTHNVGRKAYQVIVTDGDSGAILVSEVAVSQPSANKIAVQNVTEGSLLVYIACRWENLTAELDLVSATDSRVEIVPPIL